MPALTKAIAVHLQKEEKEGATFTGALDKEWAIGAVPNGGYSLSCIINAAQAFVRLPSRARRDAHVDPFHVAATYIAATECKEYECEVKVLKAGRGFTNLEVELRQVSSKTNALTSRMLVHVIMTNFAARSADPSLSGPGLTIAPDSPFYPISPIAPLEQCSPPKHLPGSKFGMAERMVLNYDGEKHERAKKLGRIEWAAWMTASGEDEERMVEAGKANNALALFADMAEALTNVYSKMQGDKEAGKARWYPTMHLVIEFKRALPYTMPLLRMGVSLTGRFIMRGQSDNDVEVWSHPDDAELLGEAKGSGSHVLAISRQVGLTMPLSVNQNLGNSKASKL